MTSPVKNTSLLWHTPQNPDSDRPPVIVPTGVEKGASNNSSTLAGDTEASSKTSQNSSSLFPDKKA